MSIDLANAYTRLTLTGIGEAPYAMRGLKMDFQPIAQAKNIFRNVNGGFVDLTDPIFRLYKISISCTDQRAPPFGGLWPGQLVTLESAIEMGEVTLTSDRAPVTGSENTEQGVTYFRPHLGCIVLDFAWGGNEYGLDYTWKLDLEEVADVNPSA